MIVNSNQISLEVHESNVFQKKIVGVETETQQPNKKQWFLVVEAPFPSKQIQEKTRFQIQNDGIHGTNELVYLPTDTCAIRKKNNQSHGIHGTGKFTYI